MNKRKMRVLYTIRIPSIEAAVNRQHGIQQSRSSSSVIRHHRLHTDAAHLNWGSKYITKIIHIRESQLTNEWN